MSNTDFIQVALEDLDHEDDSLWTQGGLPLVEVISRMIGEEVTRREITDADPLFKRNEDEPEAELQAKPEQPKRDVKAELAAAESNEKMLRTQLNKAKAAYDVAAKKADRLRVELQTKTDSRVEFQNSRKAYQDQFQKEQERAYKVQQAQIRLRVEAEAMVDRGEV